MRKCEGCGASGLVELVSIHVPNGLFTVCPVCLDAVNRKNPELQALRDRVERQAAAVERLRALVAKLDECEPHIRGAFTLAALHGQRYSGPSYGSELEAARLALAADAGGAAGGG